MSTYANSYILTHPEEQEAGLIRVPYKYRPHINDKFHIIKEGERLDTIAYLYYGDSKKWFIIADSNDIINPFLLEPGESLLIPGNV